MPGGPLGHDSGRAKGAGQPMGHARLVKAALLSMPGYLAVDSGLEDSRLGIGEALDSAPWLPLT